MTDQIAVAVIGCGFFSQNHLHSWKDLAAQGVKLAAVCDIDAAKAKAAAEKFGVPKWYSDINQMLDEETLGLVDIVTRVETHETVVGQMIARRIPTIVQKPFGPDYRACRAMTDAAQAAGVFACLVAV